MPSIVSELSPRAVDLGTAAESLSISAAKLRAEVENGQIRAIRIGKRLLIPVVALDEYIEYRLEAEAASRLLAEQPHA